MVFSARCSGIACNNGSGIVVEELMVAEVRRSGGISSGLFWSR